MKFSSEIPLTAGKRLLASTLCIFSNFRHKQQRGPTWQPPLAPLIKIERAEVGRARGTVGGLWMSCLSWVFLTLSAYFEEGCLSGERRAGFSRGFVIPGTLVPAIPGPGHSSAVVCLTRCPGEKHVYLRSLAWAWVSELWRWRGDGKSGGGAAHLQRPCGVKTFAGHPVARGGVLGVV